MLYKLVKVTDLNREDKKDEDSLNRIGRIFNIDKDKIKLNRRLLMICEIPGYEKSVFTTQVADVTTTSAGMTIKTENSYYHLAAYSTQ